jgi:hypothetical protein
MICLGTPQMSPNKLQSEAAQLYVVSWFRDYFLRKYPTGIVISELEYVGRTTFAVEAPTPLRMPGQPRLNEVLDALSHDFRRWSKDRDYRKCDVLGIANDGRTAELVEVTTEYNAASAIAQVHSKLAILRETVNRVHNLNVDWQPSPWKPSAAQLYRALDPNPVDITYLCYVPTFRSAPVAGVVLYEIHRLARQQATAPVPAPQDARQRVRQAMPRQAQDEDLETRARRFLDANPDIAGWIRAIAALMLVAAVIATIIAIIDPVPGDELLAASFAAALFRIAMGRAM